MQQSTRRLAILAVLASLLIAACGGGISAEAATVDGEVIARSRLDDELQILMDNELYRTQALGLPEAEATIDVTISSGWLQNLIVQEVVDAEVLARGLEPTEADLQNARSSLEAGLSVETFTAFPEAFQADLIERTANFDILATDLAGPPPTEEDALAYFEENRELYIASACPTDQSVAHILVETLDEANAVVADVAGGADFGELAVERSLDPGSGAAGGALGCLQTGVFVPEFEAAALAASPGVPTEPVETDFGFHVIVVDEPFVTFETFRDQVTADLANLGGANLGTFITEALTDADIEVDPRYGTWEITELGPQLVPPDTPEPRDGSQPDGAPELAPPITEG